MVDFTQQFTILFIQSLLKRPFQRSFFCNTIIHSMHIMLDMHNLHKNIVYTHTLHFFELLQLSYYNTHNHLYTHNLYKNMDCMHII